MPALITPLITWLLALIWPAAPAWVSRLLAIGLPATIQLVAELDILKDRPGPQRAEFVVKEVGELLDAELDGIPEWSELEEERRDRILLGLVELALFIHRVSDRAGGRVDLTKAFRRLRETSKGGAA